MSKEFSFPNKGTCSKQTNFVLNDDHTIASIEVVGGCNGNLKGHLPAAYRHEGRGRHCPSGRHAVRLPQHQLPGPDRKEPEKGSGTDELNPPESRCTEPCAAALFLYGKICLEKPSQSKPCGFARFPLLSPTVTSSPGAGEVCPLRGSF